MRILVFAPHADDEVLGCGGIIAKNIEKGNEVFVCIVTKACEPLFSSKDNETDQVEIKKAHELLGVKTICLDYPAAMLNEIERYKLNASIGEVINKVKPEEVYIPHKGDMHIDHKIVNEACMVALRPRDNNPVKRIFAYETLSETGWDIQDSVNTFVPNVYEELSEKNLDLKIKAMKAYRHQICRYPNPRSDKGIKALAMYRGSTVSKEYAEAFMLIREIK